MDDKQLLELAAKAAGIELACQPHNHNGKGVFTTEHSFWSPLTDDGDALRLAVKLKIDTNHGGTVVVAEQVKPHDTGCAEPYGTDRYAATRRAIVRAAAAIRNQGERG